MTRPTYIVEKSPGALKPKDKWRIARYRPASVIGTVIGYYPSRKAAILSARLLAGHSANVEVWKS